MDNKGKLYTVQSNVLVVQNKILFINNIYKNESINVIFSISGTKLERYSYLQGKNIKKSTNMYLRSALLNFNTKLHKDGRFIVFSGGISPTTNKINDAL